MIRRFILARVVAASIAVFAIAAPAIAASAARFPDSVSLPVDFAPEGIASGAGSTFYSASLTTGDIYQGDLRTGKGFVLVTYLFAHRAGARALRRDVSCRCYIGRG